MPRIAIIENGIVSNIVIGESSESVSETLGVFSVEETEETGQAFIGLGWDGEKFEQPVLTEEEYLFRFPPPEPEKIEETEEEIIEQEIVE